MSALPGKHCSKCGAWQPFAAYHRDSASHDGFRPDCKACRRPIANRYSRWYGRTFRREVRAAQRLRYRTDPAYRERELQRKRIYMRAKRRARREAQP